MKSTATFKPSWETPWYRWPVVWLSTLTVALALALLTQAGLLTRFETSTHDWRMRMRGAGPPKERIVIVAIDERTIDDSRMADPLLFWGNKHAKVFASLRDMGAKVIGFDLTQPTELGRYATPDPDQLEAQVITETPQMVLTYSRDYYPDGTSKPVYPSSLFRTALALGGGSLAVTNTAPDDDSIVRRFTVKDDDGTLSFPVAMAAMATGKEPAFSPGWLKLGERKIALNANQKGKIDYLGPEGTFPRISYLDLLNQPQKFRSVVKGSVCIIGATARSLHDFHGVPFISPASGEPTMSGVELNAHILHTFLAGSNIFQSGGIATWLLIGGAALLAIPLSWLPRTTAVLPLLAVALAAWIAVCQWAFVTHHLFLPLLPVALALVANQSILTTTRIWQDSQKKRWVEDAMGRYVSPQVLDHLRRTPGSLNLGGHRQEVTVLFSDVRGFTELSEKLEPEQVTRFLNHYLEKMVEIIWANDGNIDKFMGDGIMVTYNWPLKQPDHAARALKTAVQMQQAVNATNPEWAQMGMPPISIGVGIHTGAAILGNIGSSKLMQPTAIGDTVNVSSRVEGLCKTVGKEHDCGILISESTYHAAKSVQINDKTAQFEIIPAGETAVRGRREGLQLFAVRVSDSLNSTSPVTASEEAT